MIRQTAFGMEFLLNLKWIRKKWAALYTAWSQEPEAIFLQNWLKMRNSLPHSLHTYSKLGICTSEDCPLYVYYRVFFRQEFFYRLKRPERMSSSKSFRGQGLSGWAARQLKREKASAYRLKGSMLSEKAFESRGCRDTRDDQNRVVLIERGTGRCQM